MSLDPPTMVVGWMLVKCFLSASLPTDLSHHRSLKSASQLLLQHICLFALWVFQFVQIVAHV